VQQTLHDQGITSAGVRAGTVHVLGTNQTTTGVTPSDIAGFWHFHWTKGSGRSSLAGLGGNGVLVASDFASAHHLAPGSSLAAQTPSGVTLNLVVSGVYQSSHLDPLLGALTINTSLFDRSFTTPGDRQVYVNLPTQTAATSARPFRRRRFLNISCTCRLAQSLTVL